MRTGTLSVIAIIILGISLFTAVSLWAWMGHERELAREAHARSVAYIEAQRDFEEHCAGLTAEETFACLRERLFEAREPARAEETLAAQQRAAYWTIVVAVITGLAGAGTITVAGFAAYWVKGTLRASLAAVATATETNGIMYADQRPLVFLDRVVSCDFLVRPNDTANLQWQYTVTNAGRQPAHRLHLHQKVVRHTGGHDLSKQKAEYVVQCRHRAANQMGQILLGQSSIPADRPAFCGTTFFTSGDGYALIACLTYIHQGGKQVGVDAQVFEIEQDERLPIGPWTHQLIAYQWEREMD